MEKSHLQCVICITFYLLVLSLDATYDITYNTLGKLFNVSESRWKPANGGAQIDCVGFWVHLVVFAIIIWSRYGINKLLKLN